VSDPKVYHDFVAEFPKLNMRTGTTENLKNTHWTTTWVPSSPKAILHETNRCGVRPQSALAKDLSESVAKLETALKLLRAGGVDEYGPMKYALSLQMGHVQFYQRPPNSDVTEEQKAKIKLALEQMKQMN